MKKLFRVTALSLAVATTVFADTPMILEERISVSRVVQKSRYIFEEGELTTSVDEKVKQTQTPGVSKLPGNPTETQFKMMGQKYLTPQRAAGDDESDINLELFEEGSAIRSRNNFSTGLEVKETSETISKMFAIPENSLFVPQRVARKAFVIFEEGKFFASVEEKTHQIQSYDVAGLPNSLTEEQLKAFLGHGYLSLKKLGDDYGLDANIRLSGGGPVAGFIGYWATKAICYGAAAGTVAAATVTVAGPILGAAGGAMAAEALAATIVSSAGAGAGVAGVVAAGTMATAGATAAGEVALVMSSVGSVAGAVAAVESASLSVGGFLTLCPFLP